MSRRILACYRSTNDQSNTILSNATNQAAELEDTNGDEETWLQMEILVGLPPGRLEGADGEEEGRAIPSHLVQTMEFVCDAGYCRCNDRHIERNKKDREDKGNDDECKFE